MLTVTPTFTRAIAQQVSDAGIVLPGLLKRAIFSHASHTRLPMAVQDELWAAIVSQSKDPAIGLTIGAHLRPGHFDTLGHLVLSSPNLGAAIEALIRFSSLVGQGGRFNPYQYGGAEGLQYQAEFSIARDIRVDAILISTLQGARWLSATQLRPKYVLLTRPMPASPERYYRAFDTRQVQFGCKVNALIFYPHDWQRAVNPSHSEVREQMLGVAERQLENLDKSDWLGQVSAHLKQTPSLGRVQLAQQLNISERQMNRRLAHYGVNFKMLSEQAKRQCTLDLIAQGNTTQAALAVALGYSDESAFAKAFKRWTGVNFRAFKQQ